MAERTEEGQAVDIGLADLVTNLPVLPWAADADGAVDWLARSGRNTPGGHPSRSRGHGAEPAPPRRFARRRARLAGRGARTPPLRDRVPPARGRGRVPLVPGAGDADPGCRHRGGAGLGGDLHGRRAAQAPAAQAEAQAVLASEQVAAAHAEADARERAARAEAEMSARRALVVAEAAQALSLPVTLDAVLDGGGGGRARAATRGGRGQVQLGLGAVADEDGRWVAAATASIHPGLGRSGHDTRCSTSPWWQGRREGDAKGARLRQGRAWQHVRKGVPHEDRGLRADR